jgi:hypothetical protein
MVSVSFDWNGPEVLFLAEVIEMDNKLCHCKVIVNERCQELIIRHHPADLIIRHHPSDFDVENFMKDESNFDNVLCVSF